MVSMLGRDHLVFGTSHERAKIKRGAKLQFNRFSEEQLKHLTDPYELVLPRNESRFTYEDANRMPMLVYTVFHSDDVLEYIQPELEPKKQFLLTDGAGK
jgi:hypothetical protein